jgi:hypothetical protein
MTRPFPSPFTLVVGCLLVSCLVAGAAHGQNYVTADEVKVNGLRPLVARSHDPLDVLMTSLDTVLHDSVICCGKDSALEDSIERTDPSSLKDVAAKLQGRHLLGDGRPVMLMAEYFEPAAVNSGMLISTLRDRHALLMLWNSHLYVCYGVTYVRDYDANSGAELYTINKFLLLDTRFSDSRREVVFDRESDDWGKVEGILRLTVTPQ